MKTQLIAHDFFDLKNFKETIAECFPNAVITTTRQKMEVLGEEITVRMYTAVDADSGEVMADFWYNMAEYEPEFCGSIRLSVCDDHGINGSCANCAVDADGEAMIPYFPVAEHSVDTPHGA